MKRFLIQKFALAGPLLFILVISAGCTSRAITKPRSELLELAENADMRTPEEDRELFSKYESEQKERLLGLIRQRTLNAAIDASYRIGTNDELEINVFDVPELNIANVRVRPSGFISLPLIGSVQAAGLTETELNDDLTKRLATYVKNPQVSIFISHFGSQRVAVIGAVYKPGTFSLKKGSNSLLELLSQAGGVNERSGSFVTFIPAELSGVSASNDAEARARLALASAAAPTYMANGVELSLEQILGTGGGIPIELPVRGGDMLIVPEGGRVMVEGEVEKPGSYEVIRQMSLIGALASSGGIRRSAKLDEVELVRTLTGGERVHLIIDLTRVAAGEDRDFTLRNGDIIRVPSDAGKRFSEDTFEGITKIINFGVGGSVNLAN